jgi:hypothetical protein
MLKLRDWSSEPGSILSQTYAVISVGLLGLVYGA